MKKAVVVTCYESNEERQSFVVDSLKELNYDVTAISTNYSHIRKAYRNDMPKGLIGLSTNPYKKNLSIGRLLSHKKFAKDAFKYIENIKPDLIWVHAPAHSLIKEANKYKNYFPKTKIIIDIIDMWPESLPISPIVKKTLPFVYWKNIRKNNINCADSLTCECDLYKEILSKEYSKCITTIHWARDNKAEEYKLDLPKYKLSLAYIGSINNIIDVDEIASIIKNCDKKVELHVIGDGENKDYMLNILKDMCELIYHGPIYDKEVKQRVFAKCHAGLNIYKDNLYIGLTVKSIDYFNYGLPIINNIKGDTWRYVENYKAGINHKKGDTIDASTLIKMRTNNKNIIDLYNDNFTKEVFLTKCKSVIKKVEK